MNDQRCICQVAALLCEVHRLISALSFQGLVQQPGFDVAAGITYGSQYKDRVIVQNAAARKQLQKLLKPDKGIRDAELVELRRNLPPEVQPYVGRQVSLVMTALIMTAKFRKCKVLC